MTLAGEPVELTATEYAVLYELTVYAPRTLTHAVLLQRVWGPEKVSLPVVEEPKSGDKST